MLMLYLGMQVDGSNAHEIIDDHAYKILALPARHDRDPNQVLLVHDAGPPRWLRDAMEEE